MKYLAGLLLILLLGPAVRAEDAPIPPAELEAFVDGVMADGMRSDHVAGAAVAVVQKDQVVLLKGYGTAGLAPLRGVDPATTMFRVGSVSKTFTWILLMRLVEEGKVRLDAPVNAYLPDALKMPDNGFRRAIRVVDLMAHTPGLEDTALGHLASEGPGSILPLERYLVQHRPRQVREPGLFATYSNYGTALAGAIVAHVRGRDFHSVADVELFGPLGMTRSTFREQYRAQAGLPVPMPAALRPLAADPLSWAGGRYRVRPIEFLTNVAPAGSSSTTAADMARYMRMQLRDGVLDGVRMYGPTTAAAFRTPILKAPDGVNGWAHGFMRVALPGGIHGYGHGGATQFHMAYMLVVPELDLGVFVATNTGTGFALAERLPQRIVGHYYAQPVLQRPGDPGLAKQAGLYAGEYISTRRAWRGLEKFVLLFTSVTKVSVAEGYLMAGETAWVPEGGKGRFREALGDNLLVFNLGPDGRATSVDSRTGTNRMERAGPLLQQMPFFVLAGLTLLCALWMIPTRLKRLLHKGYTSRRAERIDRLSLVTATFWVLGFALMGIWAATLDETMLLIRFPTPLMLAASGAAILATLGSLVLGGTALFAWTERQDWPRWHAAQHSLAVLVFLAFALLLGVRGFLEPWA